MYQKYQTDALVLGSRELGESDRTYMLFTREFGLVRARASAVRTEKSKMRYALQNYALTNVSLIRGKRGWRAAGARATAGVTYLHDIKAVKSFARIAELVMRLVGGEEKNEYLYETLFGAYHALLEGLPTQAGLPALAGDQSESIEILCVARALYSLGYLSADALDTTFIKGIEYDLEKTHAAEKMRDKLLISINHALSETQLVYR